MHRLQKINNSDISFHFNCFWDTGIMWQLDDEDNGVLEEGYTDTFPQAVDELAKAVLKFYPESDFAKEYEK